MPSTDWNNVTSESTNWGNNYYIPLLGVTMNDTGYLMNDSVATMNDQQVNPIFGAPTNYANVPTNSTDWGIPA